MRKMCLLLGILSVTLTVQAQWFKKFKEGSYYDLKDVKHTGLISKEAPSKSILKGEGDHIYFRESKKADKQEITTDQLKAVVIKRDSALTDSFVVSHINELRRRPFLRVVLNGHLKIYASETQFTSSGGFNGMPGGVVTPTLGVTSLICKYYYGPDADHVTQLKKKEFISVMSEAMNDKPNIVDKIKSGYFRYDDVNEVLEAYRTGIIPVRSETDDNI